MISVIIPVYNAQSTIGRALESVVNQTYKGLFEILVINDGSTDNSLLIIKNFIQSNPNFNIRLIDQKNSGVSKARNIGLRNARGYFIAFLDSDDEWISEKIEKQINIFNSHDVDFVCGLRNNEKIVFPYFINNSNLAQISLRKLLFKVVGQTSTALFKRKIIDNTGFFDENQKFSEDANYWMRISLNNKMVIINEQLVITDNDYGKLGLSSNFREMENGVQKNINEMYRERNINLMEFFYFKSFSKFKYLIRKFKYDF